MHDMERFAARIDIVVDRPLCAWRTIFSIILLSTKLALIRNTVVNVMYEVISVILP